MKTINIALLLILSFSLSACSRDKMDGNIPSTPEARAILSVLDTYREAMESKDIDTILSIASRSYHDKMGDPDPENDVYYEDLEKKLADDFEQVRRIRLSMEILRIQFDDNGETAEVHYRYDVRYQISMPSGEKWHNALDVNRMMMVRERDGAWRVLSGL